MFVKPLVTSLSLLGGTVVASPARYSPDHLVNSARDNQPPFKPSDQQVTPARGPSFIFNDTSSAHVNLATESVAAYALQQPYDASNWFSKFTVQNVRNNVLLTHYTTNTETDSRSDSYVIIVTHDTKGGTNLVRWLRQLCQSGYGSVERLLPNSEQPSVYWCGLKDCLESEWHWT